MTALPQYDLLEAEGRYTPGDGGAQRDVIVKFGDASLIILDADDMPVTHWPLATLRNAPDVRTDKADALTVTPDQAGAERLALHDPTMIEAIRTVCPELEAHKPPPRKRWRRVAVLGAAAVAVYLAIFQLVPLLSNQMAELIPPDAEIAMGETMSIQFAREITGFDDPEFCAAPDGVRALAQLTSRLEDGAGAHVPLTVRVLDHDAANAFALPGGYIILFRGLLTEANTPEDIAGVLAHEIAHVVQRDPTRLTLRAAGASGMVGVLLGDFSGDHPTAALSEALLTSGYHESAEAAADDFTSDMLAQKGLPSAPFAAFLRKLADRRDAADSLTSHLANDRYVTERATKAAAADTIRDQPFEPALSDQQWIALRGICR